ncbi:uncharacterized protein LOC117611667 [Osmia lignaria lignaria]|uniref:uncharacterized protein LOC117611667 n=1 Tax=Osmia lignaria lignaria TaxID=1437193 RepID=UPI00147963A2|nr:uncharacterized protein LOC117611667 [Osmia lignaria]
MKSHEAWERSIEFIEHHLIPEMVQDRCFCVPNSREFVELESAVVRLDEVSRTSEIYRATIVLLFSGEPCTISLLVKLLPEGMEQNTIAFDAFQNEEMFYSKMTLQYGTDFVPKSYLSDLGRYGRPVLVFEDLDAAGYLQVDGQLDDDHLKLCAKLLGKFHATGLRLKASEPNIFREFQAKLLEIVLNEETIERYEKRSSRMTDILESMPNSRLTGEVKRRLDNSPVETLKNVLGDVNDVSTICHGHFSHDNLLFKYENGKPIDAKVIDWQTMRYCSPAVDLGPILLYNVSHENGPSKVQEILTLYVDTVKSEYPEVPGEKLREDIADKFIFVCFVLSLQEHITDDELTRILLLVEKLYDSV